MDFKQLSRSEINEVKWNACIEHSDYVHAYGTTWYLDTVCPNGWEALVWGDYDAVMPLPRGKILFYKQTFTPFWIQQLGLFKKSGVQIEVEPFHQFLENTFRLLDLCVFDASDFADKTIYESRVNYEWLLTENHQKDYSKNLKRQLKKAKEQKLQLATSTDISSLIQFFRAHKGAVISDYQTYDYDRLEQLIQGDIANGRGVVLSAEKDGIVVGMAYYQIAMGRATYLLGTSNDAGRSCGAMQFLMDSFVSEWKHKITLLDFEGSAILGLQQFYKSFGAQPKKYFRIKINRLPFPLNWMKK